MEVSSTLSSRVRYCVQVIVLNFAACHKSMGGDPGVQRPELRDKLAVSRYLTEGLNWD